MSFILLDLTKRQELRSVCYNDNFNNHLSGLSFFLPLTPRRVGLRWRNILAMCENCIIRYLVITYYSKLVFVIYLLLFRVTVYFLTWPSSNLLKTQTYTKEKFKWMLAYHTFFFLSFFFPFFFLICPEGKTCTKCDCVHVCLN